MSKVPIYQLNDKFFEKLDLFANQFIHEGFKLFENEFSKIDSFVAQANDDNSDRTDHQLRRSEKERYLLELLSYKIYDQLNNSKKY